MGIPWDILGHPGVYQTGAPINWQDINKCILVSSGAYWNTQVFNWQEHRLNGNIYICIWIFIGAYWNTQAINWQEHRLNGRILINLYLYTLGYIGTPRRLSLRSTD